MIELFPCPLCQSTNVQLGTCWVGERKLSEEPAVRCQDCGCRATQMAWQLRGDAQAPSEPHETTYLRGWNEGLEHAIDAMPSTAENPNEDSYQRGKFDGVMEYQRTLRGLVVSSTHAASAPQGDGRAVREALEFYADPFAWKKKHDPEDVVRIPDFYSETSFGDTATEALAALSAPLSVALEAGEILDAIEFQLDQMRSLKGWRMNLIREGTAKLRAALTRPQPGGAVAGTERAPPERGAMEPFRCYCRSQFERSHCAYFKDGSCGRTQYAALSRPVAGTERGTP